MRVLLLGASGFVGQNLLKSLVSRGHHVRGLDRQDFPGVLPSGSTFLQRDALSSDASLADLLEWAEVTINLIAESFVHDSVYRPEDHLAANVAVPLRLLDTLRGIAPSWFIHFSTCEVYGDTDKEGATELALPAPVSVYAATKLAGESLIAAYARAGLVRATIVRPFNLFGPHQQPNRLIPAVVASIARDGVAIVHGDGAQVRDWLFIDELIEAIHLLIARGAPEFGPEYWNITASRPMSVNDIVRRVVALSRNLTVSIRRIPATGIQITYSKGIAERARRNLGWRPDQHFDGLLADTVRALQ